MSLFLRTPRTSQPQGVVEIDWSNPLARDLSFAYLPTVGTNLVSNTPPTSYASGGNVLKGAGPKGVMVRGGSNRAARWDSTKFKGSSDYTVLSLVLDDTGRGSYRNPFDCDDADIMRVFQFRVTNSNTLQLIVFDTGSSNYSATGSTTISATEPTMLAARARSNALTVFVNGRSDGTGSAGGTLRSIQATGAKLSVGAMAQAAVYTQSFQGQIYLALHFARALSNAEIKALSDNPSQLFKPQARSLWLPGTVSAGGNSQSLGITLDGVTVAASQTLQHAQSITATLDGISVAANQTATHAQVIAVTLDGITASISQTVGAGLSQSITATLDGVTAAASQTLNHSQALTATLDDITASVSQVVGGGTYQSTAITLDDVTASVSQGLTHDQIFEATLDSIGVSASQVVRHGQSLAWALDDVTVRVVQNKVGEYTDILNSSTVVWLRDASTTAVIRDAPISVTLRDTSHTATI